MAAAEVGLQAESLASQHMPMSKTATPSGATIDPTLAISGDVDFVVAVSKLRV
jgi:hypothetical protein